MRGYVFLHWSAADPVGQRMARTVKDQARLNGYHRVHADRTSWVGVRGPRPPGVHRPRSDWLVIGEVHIHPDASHGAPPLQPDLEVARWYCENRWGRYVILLRQPDGAVRSIFRDPAGALAAFHWRTGRVQIVASETPDWLMAAAGPTIVLDWSRIHEMMAAPYAAPGLPALRGLEAVEPGALHTVDGCGVALSSPEALAARPFRDERAAAAQLRRRLDACAAVLSERACLGVELSGGLDSSIVGGTLGAIGRTPRLALNTRAGRRETDETVFAQAVAERLGVALTQRFRSETPYSAEAFAATAGDPLPSQNGRDLDNDRTVAEACRAAGIDTLMTGKGGDALFFQMHTPLAFADLWRDRPVRSLLSAHLPGVARWTRTSTWSLIRTARSHRRDGGPAALGPAKRLQVAAIAGGQAYYSQCLRTELVDMVHPLMAQPLVEWALRTPVPMLVAGGRERGLARAAFADRLPATVANRRGKGDYAACFNRQAARNLPFLRSYLLEGRLAAEGVLDRAVMEARLEVDALRWTGGAPEVLAAVSLEAWVQRWEARQAEVPRSLRAPARDL